MYTWICIENCGACCKFDINERPYIEDKLSDEDLAASYRSQADRMYKEAKRLREQAEDLVPTKKSKASAKTAS